MKRSSKIILIIMIPIIYGLPILVFVSSLVNYDEHKEYIVKQQGINYFCEMYEVDKEEFTVVEYDYYYGKLLNIRISSDTGEMKVKYNGKYYKLVYKSGEWSIDETHK